MRRIASFAAVVVGTLGLFIVGAGANPVDTVPSTEPTTTTTTAPVDLIDVCRDGKVIEIPADEVKDGDVVVGEDCPAPPEPEVIVVPGPSPAPVIVRAPVFTG